MTSLRRPRERFHWCSEKRHRQGRIEAFICLQFPVFCFLFSLYIRTDRDVIHRKENSLLCVGEKPSIVSRGMLFVLSSCFYQVSLFLCACVHLERENVLLLVFFSFQSRVQSLSYSLCVCSFPPRKRLVFEGSSGRELIGGTMGKKNESRQSNENRARISPFFAECTFCRSSIRGGMQN